MKKYFFAFLAVWVCLFQVNASFKEEDGGTRVFAPSHLKIMQTFAGMNPPQAKDFSDKLDVAHTLVKEKFVSYKLNQDLVFKPQFVLKILQNYPQDLRDVSSYVLYKDITLKDYLKFCIDINPENIKHVYRGHTYTESEARCALNFLQFGAVYKEDPELEKLIAGFTFLYDPAQNHDIRHLVRKLSVIFSEPFRIKTINILKVHKQFYNLQDAVEDYYDSSFFFSPCLSTIYHNMTPGSFAVGGGVGAAVCCVLLSPWLF